MSSCVELPPPHQPHQPQPPQSAAEIVYVNVADDELFISSQVIVFIVVDDDIDIPPLYNMPLKHVGFSEPVV